MITKKVPVRTLGANQQTLDAIQEKNMKTHISFPYPTNKYSEAWALAALEKMDAMPMNIYPYEGSQHYYDGKLHYRIDIDGHFVFKTLAVDSFCDLLRQAAKYNAPKLGKDFYVTLPEKDRQGYDTFFERILRKTNTHPMDVNPFMAIDKISEIIRQGRKFNGKSPNPSHPAARYLNGRFGLIFGGSHHLVPEGLFFGFGYRADGSSWDLQFFGNGSHAMHFRHSSKGNIYRAITDCWEYLERHTSAVQPWEDLWQTYGQLKKKRRHIRFYFEEDARTGFATGRLVGTNSNYKNDTKSIHEILLPEQAEALRTLCRTRRAHIGNRKLAFLPAGKDQLFGTAFRITTL
jgi:hypothetical protein